ncbi:MAG: ComF family protein [Acidobacteria bacterium]|nr:ComF family protein [Acidobacteriota bacterium]
MARIQASRVVWDSLFTLVFPASCRVCQSAIEGFTPVPVCPACLRAARPYAGLECAGCGLFLRGNAALQETLYCGLCLQGAFVFEQARSFGRYEGVLRSLIHHLKYDGFRPLARPLGKLLAHTVQRLDAPVFDLVLPVPLHSKRQRRRGFNQAALLAAALSAELSAETSPVSGIRVRTEDCVRVRDTRPQTGLRAPERRKNVDGAFEVLRPERVQSRHLLLVDDVITTGATVNACAQALLDAGAGRVSVVTLARAHPEDADVL